MQDLISRQAAIDALNRHSVMFEYHLPHEFYEVKKEIIELPSAQPEQRWIPCSERLPEAGQYVLRTIRKFGWYGEEYWDVDIGPYNTNEGSIIAWMPLPEPYKGE